MLKPKFFLNTLEETASAGTYVITPLPRGFGHTLGNSLRRVLLSSLEGSAITYVKIKGVTHQFDVISGVKEDVITILLNLKQIKFAFNADGEQHLVLKKKGKGKVFASDIEDSPLCKVLNKDIYICELSDRGSIEIDMWVNRGVGYESADRKEEREFNVMPMDSLFSPVTNVSIYIESTRVRRLTNYDKLTIKIETDGSITGSDALNKAASILVSYYKMLMEGGSDEPMPTQTTHPPVREGLSHEVMVDELDLPTRVINALVKNNIETVSQLSQLTDEDFGKIRGLGKKSIEELREKLSQLDK